MRKPHLVLLGESFVADNATVTGEVTLRRDASIWFGCVIRADVASITIGRGTNIQDLSVIHPEHDEPIEIGDEVTVGHGVILHGHAVGSRSLIGMGAILLQGVRIGSRCLVAAGSLVPPGMVVEDGMVIRGSPARVVRAVTEEEVRRFEESARRYVALARAHLTP